MDSKYIYTNDKLAPIVDIKRFGENAKADKYEIAADKVISGFYGNGETRKTKLTAEGLNCSIVQTIVNEKLAGTYLPNLNQEDIKGLDKGSINNCLQSVQFTLSKGDVNGSFSLNFYPETKDGNSVFDLVKVMDIVTIKEQFTKNEGTAESPKYRIGTKTVFVGIVKNKKIVGQGTDSGGMRRVSISGISAAGLLSQYYINLDVSAMALTKQTANAKELSNELTFSLLKENPLKVETCVTKIWEYFNKIAMQLKTPKVAKMIKSLMGNTASEFFNFDKSTFYYPLGCIFKGEQTQNFFSTVDGVIPEPMYEKYAYCDPDTQKMRIMIRECPFPYAEPSDAAVLNTTNWNKLLKEKHIITTSLLKNFDFQKNDNEVYTVFYAYLNGYPIDEQRALVLSTMEDKKEDKTIIVADDKYELYGYRPLICHFIGYGMEDGKKDGNTNNNLQKANLKLRSWFENLPLMLNGSITIAMTQETDTTIQPGELVEIMGGIFYVEGITHSWNYGSGGDINISLSHGGIYNEISGQFSEIENIGTFTKLLENRK